MTVSVATPPKGVSQFSTMEVCFNCAVAIRRETFNGGEPWLHGYKGYKRCVPAFVKGQFAALIDLAGAAAAFEDADRHMDGYPRESRTRDRVVTTEALREFCVANKTVLCS
jgi:hypothetical protein